MPIIHLEDGIPPSKSRLITTGGDYPDDIASYGSIIKTYTPPVGKIWEVVNMQLHANAPPGAILGDHSFTLDVGAYYSMFGKSVYGSNLSWVANMWIIADSLQYPASEVSALLACQNLIADGNNPLVVTYNNSTNVIQTNTVTITFIVKETPVI